jgi:hypothetical protein
MTIAEQKALQSLAVIRSEVDALGAQVTHLLSPNFPDLKCSSHSWVTCLSLNVSSYLFSPTSLDMIVSDVICVPAFSCRFTLCPR